MFDSYSVKKIVPRLAIAVILIQLSWFIFTGFIAIVNSIAYGVEGLIYAPFGGSDQLIFKNIAAMGDGTNGIFVAAATAGVGAGLILGGLLSLALTALLGIFIAFGVLLLRQVIIVALLVLSPIALVAWILPNTEKYWKLWWESFSKLLLMYPLVLGILAIGKVIAYIAVSVDPAQNASNFYTNFGGDDIVTFFIVIMAYFGPFFLIPKTFQLAGSAFSNLTGMVNDRGRGVFDRLKKGRQATRAERVGRAQRNALWNENRGKFSIGKRQFAPVKRLNTLAGWATDPVNSFKVKAGMHSGKVLANEITQKKYEDTEKLAGVVNKIGFNDRALIGNEDLGHRGLSEWDGSARDLDVITKELEGSKDAQDNLGGKYLRENAAFLTHAYKSEEYGRASVQGAASLAAASQGFMKPDAMIGLSNRLNGESSGLGSMIKTKAELLNMEAGLSKPGYTARVGSDGQYIAAAGGFFDEDAMRKSGSSEAEIAAQRELVVDAGIERLQSVDGMALARAKGFQIDNYASAYQAVLGGKQKQFRNADGSMKDITPSVRKDFEETLLMAHTYGNADVKGRVRGILEKSVDLSQGAGAQALQIAQKENGYLDDNVSMATARRKIVDEQLRRAPQYDPSVAGAQAGAAPTPLGVTTEPPTTTI